MDTALCTDLSNAQVHTDPEKAQVRDIFASIAHTDHRPVYIHGQSTSKTPAPLDGRRIRRTIRFRGFRWVILEVLFVGVLLYTFKDLRNIVFGVSALM